MFASHLASPAEQPERDLACADLWERSLERSRRRRDVAALHRKHAPRRKGMSLAMSAALLASPMVPMASAAGGGNGGAPTEETGSADAEGALAGDAILRKGDTGAAVAAVQRKLTVDDDGIFGPITEGAVEGFQGRTGLPVTGEVDARTWTALFRAAVNFVPESSPAAQAIQASAPAEPAAEEGSATPVDTQEGDSAPVDTQGEGSGAPVVTQEGDSTPVVNDSAPSVRAASAQPESDAGGDRTAASGGERSEGDAERGDSSRGSSGAGSSDDDSERDDSQEGDSRPAAGVNGESNGDRGSAASERRPQDRAEKPSRVTAELDLPTPVLPGGGDCATGKLATPTRGVRTSGFGDGRNHAGIDIGAPMGTAVNAALCGTVTQAGAQGAYGNIVCIRHTASFSTCYAHLSSINTRQGAYVKVGQLIGRVGSTGRSTGPHLHFETRVNGRGEDPDQYLKGGKRVPGGGSQARAASSSDSQRASSSSRQESGSTQSASSSGSQYAAAGSQQSSGTGSAQQYATGGGAPADGTSQPEQQAVPADQQPAAPPEQQPAPAEQQPAPPAEQQAAPADQQPAAPAEQQPEPSSEATVTTEVDTPEQEAAAAPAAPAE
ncbi:MAG TPA: peptidoglycan DD-metalloendopeptidase family protein, partial [Solirubrobacteraceae bacterium]|nr:peptidoglycan DD-metalloendopeptidase family protein [Solirubrobacteraceae bacterium]